METCGGILRSKGGQVYAIGPGATVLEAVQIMCAHRVGALLVCRAGVPRGIISERDVMSRVILQRLSPQDTHVEEVMTRDLVCVTPNTSPREALAAMTERRCRHLPVVVDGRVVIPAGTRVEGVVQRVEPASRPVRSGRLDLAFDRLVLDDGRALPLQSRVVSVGQQGAIDKRSAGIGAILGGVLGEVIGGTRGAVVGAIVGGAGGIAASGGREVQLPAGALLTLRLDRPLRTAEWTARQ